MVQKRGISPVIATMLLISIALLLAVIIFLWAKAFLDERIQKDLGGGPEPIESFCKDVNFEAEAFSDYSTKSYVRVVNRGNIPIHGLEIRAKGDNSVSTVGTFASKSGESGIARTIRIGEDARIDIYPDSASGARVLTNEEKEVLVTPIILGEKGTQYEAHLCDSQFAEEAEVKNI